MITSLKELNIIIAGVGGQGVVLISEILGSAAVRDGFKVRGSEVLGMAQRGGPVFSNIRLGTEVEAPVNAEGTCDILVALEPSEALRNIQYMNNNSVVILNTHKVIPTSVTLRKNRYPGIEKIQEKLKATSVKGIAIDALSLAEKVGNLQTVNVVMLGSLFGCGKVPVKIETVKECIQQHVPAKVVGINIKAFDLGLEVCRKVLT